MDFRASSPDPASLRHYAALFKTCFPAATHLGEDYLRWLYAENPAGGVVGMDAWDEGRLAAHYVCVPAAAKLLGHDCRVLLSLNTATHPDYQGKGLFTRLADMTYAAGAELGFAAVYGVANANSTPGFLRKLGFTLVAPLDAKVGVGRIDRVHPDDQLKASMFHRDWDEAGLLWRCANPARPYRLGRLDGDVLGASAPTGKPGLRAWAELPAIPGVAAGVRPPKGFRLHLGLRPQSPRLSGSAWIDVPSRFRASPLNLIFRDLRASPIVLDPRSIFFGQLDFDAF